MADNYLQTTVSGTSYQRGRSMYFENPLNGAPSVLVREERITNLGDKQIAEAAGEIRKVVSDFTTTFQLRNPTTNEIIPDATMSYQDLYVALFSLYWDLAEERDSEAQNAAARRLGRP